MTAPRPSAAGGPCWRCWRGSSPIRWAEYSSRGCAAPRMDVARASDFRRARPPSGRRSGAASGSRWRASARRAPSACPLAFLFERVDFPGRRVLGALVALPAVLPPLVGVSRSCSCTARRASRRRWSRRTSAWRIRRGACRAPGAILLVHAYSMYVYFYLFMRARRSPRSTARCSRRRRARRGTRPDAPPRDPAAASPRAGGAALLTFMTALASFSAPYIFGGGFRVMTDADRGDPAQRRRSAARWSRRRRSRCWRWRALVLLPRSGPGGSRAAWAKGTAPALARRRSARRASGSRRRLGAGGAAAAAPSHADAGLVRAGRHLDDRAVPARAITWATTRRSCAEPERLRPLREQPVDGGGGDRGGDRAGARWRRASCVRRRVARRGALIEGLLALPWAVPGTVFAIALATAFSVRRPLGRAVGAGRDGSGSCRWRTWCATCRSTGRAILAGFRQLDPALDEAAAIARRRSRADAPPRDAAAAPARARRRREPRVRHRARRLRDLDHAVHVRHATHLARDPLQPPAVAMSAWRRPSGCVLMAVSAAVFAVGADRGGAG